MRRPILLFAMLAAATRNCPAAEVIDVTGTRLAEPSEVSLNGAQIEQSGVTSLGALLDELPSFGNQGVNDAQNDGGFGENFVDLRNLNFNRTLVLVDGARFVLSGIQTDEAVDLNTIPAAFVDRIVVDKDGTQPRLGADAVAGAVDLRLRHGIQGVRLEAYGGAASAGDNGTAELSLLAGSSSESGSITLGADLLRRDPIRQSDRGWAAAPITGFTDTGAKLIGSPATPGGHAVGEGVDSAVLGAGETLPYDPATDRYDFAANRYLLPGLQRASLLVEGERSLPDGITGWVDLLYTDRRATTLLPPQTLGLTGTERYPDGFVVPAADPFNPFGVPVTLERVVTEAGPQRTLTGGPVWRVTAGLRGGAADWTWQVSLDHGESLSRYRTTGAINLTRALQTVGDGACPPASGCVAANWFGPGSLSPAALSYVAYTSAAQSHYAETVLSGSLALPLPSLPGGAARLLLGAETRREDGATTVDAITGAGDQAGPDAAPTAGGYATQEAFATADLPLLRNKPGLNLLQLKLEARATRSHAYGAYPALRGELDYGPVRDFTVHGVIGTGRRPPAIAEAFGGVTDLALPVTDPCDARSGQRANPVVNRNCLTQGLGPGFTQFAPTVDVASGGNPALRPERSQNEMLGAVWQPAALPRFSVSLDWWRYRIDDAIDSLADTDPDAIPAACYASPDLGSPLCRLVTRIQGGGAAGQISRILARDENVGTIETSGLDAALAVQRTFAGVGAVALDSQATWLLDYRLRTAATGRFSQYAGTFPSLDAVGSYARLRTRTTMELMHGPWRLGITTRTLSGARVRDVPGEQAGLRVYDDLAASRRIAPLDVTAGITNLTDARPPHLLDGVTNTDTATYEVAGRFVWMRLSCAW